MHASERPRKDLSRVIELAWAEFARETSMEWKVLATIRKGLALIRGGEG